MIVYRLCRSKYQNDLNGKGAEIAGGRWNSKGVALLYTCENRALATAEVAVHTPMGIVPTDYVLLTLEIDNKSISNIDLEELPPEWKMFPFISQTKKYGNQFVIDGLSLALKVPSAVVQGEFNYLINPRHPDFENADIISQEPFEFDQRLFR